jgi:2-oxoglutarate ferredoxin oxidoreductase subunit alpha
MPIFKDDLTIVLAGEAGQGIQTIEAILTSLLKSGGYHIFATKEYMSRVRGGINSTTLRIASRRVAALREKIDLFIPLHREAITHLRGRLTEKTVIIGDQEKINYHPMIDVAFMKMAGEMGGSVYANTLAVGLLAGLLKIDREKCRQFIARYFGRKNAEITEKNIAAAQRGFEIGAGLAEKIVIGIDRDDSLAEELMLTGGEAVALGALAGGCNYLCAYPMSPGTAVLTHMAAYAKSVDVIVEQVEDEIGVVNMAIAAWYAGARAMVTTSGGGFALMTEGVSLAGMIETPLVVHLAQRPGPATGLPTRTEQGDLNLVLYAGQGEFPRIILAPKNIEEAFFLSQQAFNLADKYQVPVFILTDQYLMDTYYNQPRWKIDHLPVEKHVEQTRSDYRRFRFTDSGISPRGIPGFGEGIVCVDSDEHDEGGYITEDSDVRVKMVQKRLRKAEVVKKVAHLPAFTGTEGYETLIVGWGSTYPALAEALEKIGRPALAHLHFSWLYPLAAETAAYLQKANKVIVVEQNATGQFGQLLKLMTGCPIESILKYNGLPFSVEELVTEIRDRCRT